MSADITTAPLRPRGLGAEAAMIGRGLKRSARDTEALLMAVMLPIILMLLFTFVFGGALDPSGEYVDYVVPGIILICAGFGASSTATQVALDSSSGFLQRLRTMDVRASSVLTGHVAASLVRNLLATLIVITVALLVGFRPTAGLGGWCAAVGMIALWILAITQLFAAIGLAASGPEAASGYGFALLFLPYLSGAFVPLSTMPTWLSVAAQFNPVTPVVETIRAALMGTDPGLAPWGAVAWCVGILLVATGWGAWLFRASRRARRS